MHLQQCTQDVNVSCLLLVMLWEQWIEPEQQDQMCTQEGPQMKSTVSLKSNARVYLPFCLHVGWMVTSLIHSRQYRRGSCAKICQIVVQAHPSRLV
ncbi:hypothetical protein ACHAW6_000213 [Cyclotella cf. meneghiniana]